MPNITNFTNFRLPMNEKNEREKAKVRKEILDYYKEEKQIYKKKEVDRAVLT